MIEVSESSLRYDRKVKVPLYARHNVPEVWIVDASRLHIHFFHTLEAGRYLHTSSTPSPGTVSLHALPSVAIDLAGLFDDI